MTDHERTAAPRRIAVIGGGITGLAAAHRIVERAPDCEVKLFEAGDRLGGALHTVRHDGFLLEMGADNFITSVPYALDLCRRIGFADNLLESNPAHRRALVARSGRLYPVPEGFMLMEPRQIWPVLRSPLLSLRGKLRLLSEWFIPARQDGGDESLASFARRRLGSEAFERLVQPLVAGIYTADPEKLSLAATLPRFLDMERQHGGLIRAARRQRAVGDKNGGAAANNDARAGEDKLESTRGSAARYSLFVAPRDGMQSIVEAVAARLPAGAAQLNTPLARLAPRPSGGWDVSIEGVASPQAFDAVILATPAYAAGQLVEGFDGQLGASLASIDYASSAVIVAAYEERQFGRPLDAFGFVVPDIERRPIIAGSFASVKYPGRAPAGWVVVRIFVGGAARPELATAPDDELQAIVARELGDLLGLRGPPRFTHIARWHRAMPQYHVGHMQLVAKINERANSWRGLALAGSAYQGVGVPGCIHSGEEAAERVLASQRV